MEKGISIIIPIYNEEKAVSETISRIKNEVKKFGTPTEIFAINDASTDKTGEILSKIEGIQVLAHPYNMGYGASLKTGIRKARYEKILIVDSDATYPIEKINELVKYAYEYNMVVGARIGKNVHLPIMRKIGKSIINFFANIALSRYIPDLNSGFRIFDRETAIKHLHLFPSRFSFTTTITMIYFMSDLSVKFVPIDYFKRTGKSSIRPFHDFFGFLILITKIVVYYNPLKFFLPAGFFIFLLGTGYLLRNLVLYLDVPDGAIFLVLFGVQIIFTGFLADIFASKRREV